MEVQIHYLVYSNARDVPIATFETRIAAFKFVADSGYPEAYTICKGITTLSIDEAEWEIQDGSEKESSPDVDSSVSAEMYYLIGEIQSKLRRLKVLLGTEV